MKKLNSLLSLILPVLLASIVSCSGPSETAEDDTIGLDLTNIDSTVTPSEDFFRFVNGRWVDRVEIPSDRGSWGSFAELREASNDVVLNVLTKAAESDQYDETTDQRKAADFFDIGMDSAAAEGFGLHPLDQFLERIDAISSVEDLDDYMAYQQGYTMGAFFGFGVIPDLMKSDEMGAYIFSGGLGLPERDYYTKTDDKSVETREKYLEHLRKMFDLAGLDDPASAADQVMELETRLANATLTKEAARQIDTLYNKYTMAELEELVPSVDWASYFEDIGVENVGDVIVTEPLFMEEYERIATSVDIGSIKNYLRWHLINGSAAYLNYEMVKADFDFYSNYLQGVDEMRPRWKRVLGNTSNYLGEAIGKLYVDEAFPPEAKEKAQKMVNNIKLAFADRIKELEWMSDSTKEMALKKLNTITVKIGYPDEWKNYSELIVDKGPERGSYLQNIMNGRRFQFEDNVDKYGKPVDKKEWGMTPQTVNAYYNPLFNEIVFPAAILQPPFYDYRADEAVNYGGMGAVIGHEISHGFDDQGSRFDAEGNMINWWTAADYEKFRARTGMLEEQFSMYEPLDSVFVNGQFTLGENIGDLGGVAAAFDGLQRHLREEGNPGLIDGLTPEQRFFMSWATVWRIKYKDETLRTQINTDPHSPGMYRANGPLSNLEAFYEAFDVKPGDPMYRPDSLRVKIW